MLSAMDSAQYGTVLRHRDWADDYLRKFWLQWNTVTDLSFYINNDQIKTF